MATLTIHFRIIKICWVQSSWIVRHLLIRKDVMLCMRRFLFFLSSMYIGMNGASHEYKEKITSRNTVLKLF